MSRHPILPFVRGASLLLLYPSLASNNILILRRFQGLLDFFGTIWFVIGNWWLFTSKTCSTTSPAVFYTALVCIIFGYIIISLPLLLCVGMVFCFPCLVLLMQNFVPEETNGVSPRFIRCIPLSLNLTPTYFSFPFASKFLYSSRLQPFPSTNMKKVAWTRKTPFV